MTEITPRYDHEIDLLELFETLWRDKWKIISITFVAAVIGVGFSVLKPSSYEVSIPIQNGNQSVFLPYTSLNEILKEEGLLYNKNTNPYGYVFNNASVFIMFIKEFNDYEEMIDALSKSVFVQQSIKDLIEEDKQKKLLNFAKAFKLKAPSKNENDWTLSFEWHDYFEGLKLFNDALHQTLLNVKIKAITDINNLADTLENRIQRNLDNLLKKLIVIKQNQNHINMQYIQYLNEQSAIAKELGIETNRLDANALLQSSQNAISLSENSNDVPFYLRGYKAIDKEIALIQSRSEEYYLNSDDYLETKKEILSLENDLSPSQLRKETELLANDKPNNWVEFNLEIANYKSQKNSMLYVALSMALGGMVGVMYVLISNTFRKRKEQLVKV